MILFIIYNIFELFKYSNYLANNKVQSLLYLFYIYLYYNK